jgi:hypothetical protein
MATLDFTKQGNQVQVTLQGSPIQCYIGYPVKYSFDAAGTTLNVTFGNAGSYSCALADLRVAGSGSAPASVAAALTALSAVFGMFP